jgi:hypothetical protein
VHTDFIVKLFELRQSARSDVSNNQTFLLYWPDMIICGLWDLIVAVATGSGYTSMENLGSIEKLQKQERFRAVTQLPSMCMYWSGNLSEHEGSPLDFAPLVYHFRVDITTCETLWYLSDIRLLSLAIGASFY